MQPILEGLRFRHNEFWIFAILGSTILNLVRFIEAVCCITYGPLLESGLILELFVCSSN